MSAANRGDNSRIPVSMYTGCNQLNVNRQKTRVTGVYRGRAMQSTIEFLDAISTKHGGASDYRLAKLLGVTRGAVSAYRCKRIGLSDELALKVAAELNLDPVFVLACAHAERAKQPEIRAIWERVAVRVAAGVVLGIGIGGILAGMPDAPALAQVSAQVGEVCILCKIPVRIQDIDFNPVYVALALIGAARLARRAR